MALREPAPIPIAFDFTRFLASSLTFMRHLSEVSVYFDDKRLVKLNKASGLPRDMGVPKGLSNRSPSGIMSVDGIQTTRKPNIWPCIILSLKPVHFVNSSLHPSASHEMDIYVWHRKETSTPQNQCNYQAKWWWFLFLSILYPLRDIYPSTSHYSATSSAQTCWSPSHQRDQRFVVDILGFYPSTTGQKIDIRTSSFN